MIEDNKDNPGSRFLDWLLLPLQAIFFILGIGIVTGLLFRESGFLEGTTRVVIGMVFIIYGGGRGYMILRKLRMNSKGAKTGEKNLDN